MNGVGNEKRGKDMSEKGLEWSKKKSNKSAEIMRKELRS